MPTTDAQMGFGVPTNIAPAGQRAVMATKGFLPWSSSLGSGMIQPSLLLVGSSLLPSQLSRSCDPLVPLLCAGCHSKYAREH